MLDFKYLVFLSAARRLSFSKAAKELSLTQPAVSFQIRHLENSLDTKLFIRYPNRIELAPIGKLLLKEVEDINLHANQAKELLMKKLGKLWGTVVVGASSTIGNYFLPSVLAQFKGKFDDAGLRVLVGNTNEVLAYLADGIVDFAIVEGPVKVRQWDVEEAFVDELMVIAPTSFSSTENGVITKEQLAAQPFISRESGSGTRAIIDALKDGQKQLIPPSNIELELGSNTAIKQVVESGLGISIVSLMTLQKEIKAKSISILRIADFPIYRKISFVFNRGMEKTMLMEELITLCKEKAKKMTVGSDSNFSTAISKSDKKPHSP